MTTKDPDRLKLIDEAARLFSRPNGTVFVATTEDWLAAERGDANKREITFLQRQMRAAIIRHKLDKAGKK